MYKYAHKLQDSVKATRYDITPVGCEWTDFDGNHYTTRHNLMVEARGADGSYVRGYTTTILGERR